MDAGENNDELVTRIRRLGDERREVRGFPALRGARPNPSMASIGNSCNPRDSAMTDYVHRLSLTSPQDILDWSFGEVSKTQEISFRTGRPVEGGLFCERIFGPVQDWECSCGKYRGQEYQGYICDRCGVKCTHSRVRRNPGQGRKGSLCRSSSRHASLPDRGAFPASHRRQAKRRWPFNPQGKTVEPYPGWPRSGKGSGRMILWNSAEVFRRANQNCGNSVVFRMRKIPHAIACKSV